MSGLDGKGTMFPNGIGIDKGELFIGGIAATVGAADLTALDGKATALTNVLGFAVAARTGGAGQKACLTNGLTIISATGAVADMTLGAPTAGAVAIIRVAAADGNIVVNCASKFDGTNTKATFDAAEEALVLVANGTSWAVALNVGGVTLAA